MPKPKKTDEKFDFSAAYGELEKIVAWFEREDADLDQSLEKFERGLELARQCQERLKQVENRINQIRVKFDELESEPVE